MAGGRVGVIVGATGGVGENLASLLAARGDRLTLLGRDRDKLAQLESSLARGGSVGSHVGIEIDFSSPDEGHMQAVFEESVQRFGAINYVVNCAGAAAWWPANSMSLVLWERIIAVNLTSAFLLSKHAISCMAATGGGVIVHIASVAGRKGSPFASAYCSAKAGLLGLCRSLALEAAADGIKVVAVVPGAIETAFVDKGIAESDKSLRKLIRQQYASSKGSSPRSIARVIMSLLDQPEDTLIAEVAIRSP